MTDAAMKSDAAAVRALLAKKVNVNVPQVDGTTALHWAVYNENLALVDQLLAAGADPAATTDEGATPLYLASVVGNAHILDRLLRHGADATATVLKHGDTVLMFAAPDPDRLPV